MSLLPSPEVPGGRERAGDTGADSTSTAQEKVLFSTCPSTASTCSMEPPHPRVSAQRFPVQGRSLDPWAALMSVASPELGYGHMTAACAGSSVW